jgi:hypothetical protein
MILEHAVCGSSFFGLLSGFMLDRVYPRPLAIVLLNLNSHSYSLVVLLSQLDHFCIV